MRSSNDAVGGTHTLSTEPCESSCPTLSGVAGRSAWDAFGSSASHGTGIGSASASPVGQQARRRRCLVELTNTTARGVTATGRTRGRCVRSNGRGDVPACRPPKIGPAGPVAAPRAQRLGRWFIVVCRDRAELCQQLGESFGGDSRIMVVLDRRHSERRGRPEPKASLAAERRRWPDRRTPPTGQDAYTWASLGFRPHRDRSLGPP